jgi:two-component system sensor histidine kinase UhpB
MRRPSLLSQILAFNVLLVAVSVFIASLAAGLDLTVKDQRNQFLVMALAILLGLFINMWLLRRRFEPLERLLATMERIDLSRPGRRLDTTRRPSDDSPDVERLAAAFNRMLERLEGERRRSGERVLKAQEEERKRVARDLHDEVNQALTALLLRLEAAAQHAPGELRDELEETKRLANRAMAELLDLARQLRPAALDDHGLGAALAAHVR